MAADGQIDKQTNRWTEPMRKGAVAAASGALVTRTNNSTGLAKKKDPADICPQTILQRTVK